MAIKNSLKLSGAIAAGVLALGLSAPANAGTLNFEIQYDTVSALTTTVVDAFVNVTDAGFQETQNGITYEVYNINNLSGTQTVTLTSSGTIVKQNTITGLYNPVAPTIDIFGGFYDDALFIDLTSATKGLAAFDTTGVAFSTSDGAAYKLFYDVDGLLYNSVIYYYDQADVSTDSAVLNLTATQVPAPAPLALLGVSLVGVGLLRRRKQENAA